MNWSTLNLSLGLLLCILMLTGCSSPKLVSFPTQDGGIVFADLSGEGERGLVLAHGAIFNKESWADQAQVFADEGFLVLAIDFRGRGQSVGPPNTNPNAGVHFDVLGAADYLRQNGATSVSVIGASFGGWAASTAAVQSPGWFDRIVLLASVVEEPEKLTGRKLFILSRDDGRTDTGSRLERVEIEFERAPEPKELVVLEGSAHAQFIFETDQSDKLMAELIRFLTAP